MKTQLSAVEEYINNNGKVAPSHLSLLIEGRLMSYESFCRHLRTLHSSGKIKQRRIEKGRIEYYVTPIIIDEALAPENWKDIEEFNLSRMHQSQLI